MKGEVMEARKTPEFIPGLRLSELFHNETVSPILAVNFPKI
jgi:hypothetical protein